MQFIPILGSPSKLYLGDPVESGFPVWAWATMVGVVLVFGVAVLVRRTRDRKSVSQRATDKLAKYHRVDHKTRRALSRAATLLELKSPAGLLVSATALAEAVQRCDTLKNSDRSRLSDLAVRIAKDQAPFQGEM